MKNLLGLLFASVACFGACNDSHANAGACSGSGGNPVTPMPWSQSPSGTLSQGFNTVTLSPCPPGLNGTDANHWVYIYSTPTALNIDSATPGAPASLSIKSHGLSTGQFVTVVTPTGVTWATGPWSVTDTGTDSLNLNSSAVESAAAITSITGDGVSPIVITLGSSIGAQTGDTLIVSGVNGNTAANGTWTVTRVDDGTYSLDESTGNGDWSFGGEASLSGTSALGGSATLMVGPEAARIIGGTCTSGAPSGTITFTAANPHEVGYTIGSATAGISEAIISAIAAGTNQVFIPAGAYTVQGPVVPLPSNFVISGAGPSTVITLAAGTPNIYLFSASGSLGTATTTSTRIAYPRRATTTGRTDAITVGSTSGMSTGAWLQMQSGTDPTYGNSYVQMAQIESISGNAVKIADAMGIPLQPAYSPPASITPYTPVTGVTIRDMTIDGGSPGLSRYITGYNLLEGVNWTLVNYSTLSHVQFRNWTSTCAVYAMQGYGNTFTDLRLDRSGSGGQNDISVYWQTRPFVHNILSTRAEGFGPGAFQVTYGEFTNISVSGSLGRAFKLNGTAWSNFTNLTMTRSNDNGLAFAGGAYRNSLANVTVTDNHGFEGVWFGGSDSQYNTIDHLQACGNGSYPDSYYDVTLYHSDHDNTINNARLCNKIKNESASANNLVNFAEPMASSVYNSGNERIPSAAYTPITWDTNVRDVGPTHSASRNLSRFTVPAFQGCVANGCAQVAISGQVCWAANSKGVRGVKIVQDGANVVWQSTTRAVAGLPTCMPISATVTMADGDYIEAWGYQSSGSALDIMGGQYDASALQVRRLQ